MKTTGRPLYSLAKFLNSTSALLLPTKNSNYLSGQIGSSEKRSCAAEVLMDQIIIQALLVNKTNHLSVLLTSEETTFDMSANFGRLPTKEVIQSELDTFFT